MAPLYIVFRASWPSPQLSLANLDNEKINLEHFLFIKFMCSLKVRLVSITIPKYFRFYTCVRMRKFKYSFKSFRSLRFLLDSSIVFYFCSLKCILFVDAHADIFASSILSMFSASITVFALVTRIRSSANAMTLVRCV
jgi:hypothetical protein